MVTSKDESATDSDNSSGDVPASHSSLYSEGEKVLAYHGPRIYKAKVQKSELRENEWRYFVHYLGWNKNWDEWVGTDRLMKFTDENIMKQQELDKKQGVEKNPKLGRSSQTKPRNLADLRVEKDDTKNNDLNVDKEETKTNVAKGKKRKADSAAEDNAATEKHIKIQIPSNLKKQLVDDWEFISKKNLLVKLPRSPSVDNILTKYLELRSKKDVTMADSVGEILNGIRSYFDKALPVILLYKKERQQYHDVLSDKNVSPSSVYGAEHLLRLFVKLPELLACVKIEEETLTSLQQILLDFLKFLQKNQNTYFLSSYGGSIKGKDS
ncbi:unnamed protein product [Cuscuta campestris]|uniref:Chromo domain-containing protein n=2 Tax=Cuscuta sect. Cleistogrammica TaxID=1824901 RepID=A0A484K197_9ASTE|nr:hypothetical protein DM860_008447 [Cuscuta australis]VFQ58368.1 unnamed protein product [Cuscuta campestris]